MEKIIFAEKPNYSNFKDLTDCIFEKWTVLGYAGQFGELRKRPYWWCKCECGNIVKVLTRSLTRSESKSCGCLCREKIIKTSLKHGNAQRKNNSRLYKIWCNMKTRVKPNINSKYYKDYYLRGIRVCEEWANSFTVFNNWAISNGYADNLTIDRINNDKGYSPDNCRWASSLEQGQNKQNTIKLTFNNKTCTLKERSIILNIPLNTLRTRLKQLNWSVERTLTTPSK